MSMGPACTCPERAKPLEERDWTVLQFQCNHSAFNGYHYTHSDWSSITCNKCRALWRTKADYVTDVYLKANPLPEITDK